MMTSKCVHSYLWRRYMTCGNELIFSILNILYILWTLVGLYVNFIIVVFQHVLQIKIITPWICVFQGGNTPESIQHQADGGHYCFPESIKGNKFIKNNPMPASARPHIYFNHFFIWVFDSIEFFFGVAAKRGRRTMFDCCLDLIKFVS